MCGDSGPPRGRGDPARLPRVCAHGAQMLMQMLPREVFEGTAFGPGRFRMFCEVPGEHMELTEAEALP